MSKAMLVNILPLIILAGSAVVIMLIAAIRRNHLVTQALTLLSLITAIFFTLNVSGRVSPQSGWLFSFDGPGVFFTTLILFAAFIVTALSYHYLDKFKANKEEYYLFILLGTLGASALAVSNHFIAFFLGLELLSVTLYVLIGYLKIGDRMLEASVKYLILGGVSSAFLVMGMALVYARTGTFVFTELMAGSSGVSVTDPILLGGSGLMLAGVGFKLAVVPFHLWTPDIYEGAPAPVTAFIASASKGGVVAALLRFFSGLNVQEYPALLMILGILAVLSMLIGNILALLQQNVKRILAYSSIAHLGYVLVAFIAGGARGTEAVGFYLLAYMITILGAFGIVTILSDENRDAHRLEDYTGLFWRNPWLAAIFTAMLLSLAGIPLTAGFMGKFYVLSASVSSQLWLLSVVLVIGSVIGLFYYLRILVELFKKPDHEAIQPKFKRDELFGSVVVLSLLFVLVVWFGILPGEVVEVVRGVME